jgi:hypothetical protein
MRVALCLLQKAAPYLDGGEMASMVEEKICSENFGYRARCEAKFCNRTYFLWKIRMQNRFLGLRTQGLKLRDVEIVVFRF